MCSKRQVPYLSVAGRYRLHGIGGFELDFQLVKLVHFVFICIVEKICGRKKNLLYCRRKPFFLK